MSVLKTIQKAKLEKRKLLAILLDPDKVVLQSLNAIITKIETLKNDFICVGGSSVKNGKTKILVKQLKRLTALKIVLFPGDVSQITASADALLFLSLLSGLNPEYLITQQIKAISKLKNTNLEIIPTGYILIDGGIVSSVQKQSRTIPLSQNNKQGITDTALAGELMGKQIIYLEAGSGAKNPVSESIIKKVASHLQIPIIVGGGIRTQKQVRAAYNSGANLVVIGTAFEENILLLKAD